MMRTGTIFSRFGRARASARRDRRLIAGLAAFALGFAALPAWAQGECACLFSQSLIPDIAAAGRIESFRNTVVVITPQGRQAARPGQALAIADSVQTGPDGRALIVIGAGCRIQLAPGSTLRIWPVDNHYCAAVDRPPGGTAGNTRTILPPPGIEASVRIAAAMGGGID